MCTMSYVGDLAQRVIPQVYPWVANDWNPPTRKEFDALKKEVESLHEALRAAKEYDERTGQADCETEDKVAFIRQLAEIVGVDLEDVLQ